MPAKRVFLDTNGWIALLNLSDTLHSAAEVVWARFLELGYSVVLTDWIIAETGNGLARTSARNRFAAAVGLLRSSSRVQVVPVSEGLFQRALDLYASRADKSWGLVDCASFIVMQDEAVSEAFTNDRHFEQAGLRCLLPSS